jgi:predicted dithiol-disulfide oxidoreductase (DUF899 family)
VSRSDDGKLGKEPAEVPGVSCFLRAGDSVFHTYSTYARGTDQLGSSYTLLDLTALGRPEDWEEPKGRVSKPHGADPPSPTEGSHGQHWSVRHSRPGRFADISPG